MAQTEVSDAATRVPAVDVAKVSAHSAANWQTRAVRFAIEDWNPLRPDGKSATTVTQQSMAEVIAIVFGDDDAQAEANARLIAAAPELLDALKLLMEQPTEHPLKLTPDQRTALWAAHAKARAAIAKARP